MHLSLSDGHGLAEHLADNVINGNCSYVREELKKLNAFQAIYVFSLFETEQLLDQKDRNTLARILSGHMNDD